jgi:hypothetical protein
MPDDARLREARVRLWISSSSFLLLAYISWSFIFFTLIEVLQKVSGSPVDLGIQLSDGGTFTFRHNLSQLEK